MNGRKHRTDQDDYYDEYLDEDTGTSYDDGRGTDREYYYDDEDVPGSYNGGNREDNGEYYYDEDDDLRGDYGDEDDGGDMPLRGSRRGRLPGGTGSRRSGRSRVPMSLRILLAAMLVVIAVGVYQIAAQLLEYQSAAQEYETLSSLFEPIPETESAEDAGTDSEEAGDDGEDEASASYPKLAIDYDSLKSINEEFVGIIYLPALDLIYPVAQAANNTDYLTKTFEGSTNSSGCIYLDALSDAGFINWNTYIYGHNMKNLTMFGSLKLFIQEEDLCNTDPYIYIYQEDQVLTYRIFAYYTIPVRDDVYEDFYDEDGYDAYVADAFVHSQYTTYSEEDAAIDWSARPNLLTLSTCYGTDHTYNFIVQGALVRTDYLSEDA